MDHRRTVRVLLLVAALASGGSASAQLLNPPNRDSVSEDEAVIALGAPAGSRLRGESGSLLSRRPVIDDDAIQRTQATVNVQLDDSLPAVERGELNATPPGYERYSATSGLDRPTRLDYIFINTANVHSPLGGSVLMNEINLSHRFRLPFGDRASLRVQPFFNVLFLNGPNAGDPILPGQLYKLAADVELGFRWSESILLSVAVTPGVWSDFNGLNTDDFRLPARAILAYKWSEGLYVSAGVIYTANYYHNILPTAGIIWDVTDRWRFELVAPRGRIVYRLHQELQFYAGIEGGGDTYTIHVNSDPEKFQYRDYRFFTGTEVATWERASVFLETGFVFNRRFRAENQNDRNIDSAFFLRLGLRF
jgi:hypothetical protein